MEKEKLFMNSGSPPPLSYAASPSSPPPTWHSSSSGMEVQVGELNCSSEQIPNCYVNLNWENPMDQNSAFESALRSMVSSPAASNATVPSDPLALRELIGRLGNMGNSGDISPSSQTLGGSSVSYTGGNNSTNTSCYSTPLNSPPKLNLSMMDNQIRGNLPILGNSMPTHPGLASFLADTGFVERAARFSCFGSGSFRGLPGQFRFNENEFPYRPAPRLENGKLSRVSSSRSLKAAGSHLGGEENKDSSLQNGVETELRSASASALASDRKFRRSPDGEDIANAQELSPSDQIPGGDSSFKGSNDANARKRKAAPRGKAKELPLLSPHGKDAKAAAEEDPNAKKCKLAGSTDNENNSVKEKPEPSGSTKTTMGADQKESKESQKPPEPPKDYIHVRARRGQATDSHSLAERVRREKISERMKFLQDLVPGCNKVTGKATMLDEIINYVQSLQRQVEFLSMKLATVNPRMDFNMESLLSKDILQSRASLPHTVYPLDSSASTFPFGQHTQQGLPLQSGISNVTDTHCSANPLDAALRQNIGMQLHPVNEFGESAPQISTFWEDDLQSVVQMGFGQNQSQTAFHPQNFHGSLPTAHMKIEL